MDTSQLMTHAKLIESEKLQKMKMKESKRACIDGGFSHSKPGGGLIQKSNGHLRVLIIVY